MKKLVENFTNNQAACAWIFILPALIGTLMFIIVPIFCSFGLSFVKWDLLGPVTYVGFGNYKEIFSDGLFIKIFINTFVFFALYYPYGCDCDSLDMDI